jgi:class 3 adenylate cyclase/tetratricopeptide (TPR) repeat protein
VCGTVNPADARFCSRCGSNLEAPGALVEPLAGGATRAPKQERRLVSVMFADLVGYTTVSEARDAEDMRDLLTRYYEAAREVVDRYGGTIEKFIGDAVMAVWGTPSAHEDDAERAVRAAIEIVSAVPRLDGAADILQARAGVLTGEAAVWIGLEGQGMIAGDLVNTASRLQSAAEPGTVLVGEATYRATSSAIAYEAAGTRELKGKARPVHVWTAQGVVGRRGGAGRSAILEPPFVGRDDELQQLKDVFHATAREGKPRLITVWGVAGIGKSRLLWEFEKYLDGIVDSVYVHTGRSPAYGEGISYWALAEMVRGRCSIVETDDDAAAAGKLRATLEQYIPDEKDRRWVEPRIAGLLGLEALPSERREELFAAWRMFFERLAEQLPVVMGFWDSQWADQGTLDFVEHLLNWSRSSPILVLAEARPELFERRPDWGRSQRASALIHLGPLAEEDMTRLLRGLVPDLPPEPLRRIVDRADGVPLYVVETLRMLVDRRVLVPKGEHLVLAADLPELAIPETLQALIAARLDALPERERTLLTRASVLGVSFAMPSLAAVAGMPRDAVDELTAALVRRELLVLDADARSPERGLYRFVQGVVREVAYQSLARRNRQAIHLAAARHLETLADGEHAGVLANHYLAAYRAAPAGAEANALAAQARVALRAAAERAASLHDLAGSLSYLEQAIDVTPDAGEQAPLRERALVVAGNFAQFDRAHEHAEAAVRIYADRGDRLGELRARARQASVYHMEHHEQLAITTLRDLIASAADLPPSGEIADVQSELARALMLSGASAESVAWTDQVLEHPEVAAPRVIMEALITKGTALTNVGRVVEAEALLRGAVAIADAQGNLDASLRGRNNLRVVVQWIDLAQALVLATEVLELARRYGIRAWVLHGVSSTQDVGYRRGTFEPMDAEVLEEIGDPGEFYGEWFALEAARRAIYRGDPAQAEERVDRALGLDVIRNSAQAITWNLSAKADALIPQGRFAEAHGIALRARDASAEHDLALVAALFSAAGAGDLDGLETARDWCSSTGLDRLPSGAGYVAIADALEAALLGRLDEATAAYATARMHLERVGEGLTLGRLHLAYGHVVGDTIEGRAAAARADAFFETLGGGAYAAMYRARAVRASSGTGARTGSRDRGARAPALRTAG